MNGVEGIAGHLYLDGSCVTCGHGTDTGLAFAGEAEWAIAGLTVLGIPETEAVAMVSASFECDPGTVPESDICFGVRVCQACVEASGVGFKVDLALPGQPLPTYSPVG